MKTIRIRAVDAAALAAGAVATLVYTHWIVKRTEKFTEQRLQIQFEAKLDIAAIARARDITTARIHAGHFSSWQQAQERLATEIEIQKIAIREE